MVRSSYVGATDSQEEGVWVWDDGTPWGFSNWGTDEPNGGPDENCIEIVSVSKLKNIHGWWNDVGCGAQTRGYICSYMNSKHIIFLCS